MSGVNSWSRTTSNLNVRDGPRSDDSCSVTGIIFGAGPEPAGDGRGAILEQRADGLAGRRELGRRKQARQHRVDVGARHRELGRAQVVHRMAEGVDAVAVDVRDRAGAAEQQIAGDEVHADGIARLERAVERHQSRGRRRRCRAAVGTKPWSRKAAPSVSATSAEKPDITSGVAMGRSIAADGVAAESGDARIAERAGGHRRGDRRTDDSS